MRDVQKTEHKGELGKMGERYTRQVRKSVNKLWRKAILELKEYVELLPLKQRIRLAFNIVFKCKFEL